MEDKSPTDNGDDQSSSDNRTEDTQDESLLDKSQQDQSADDTNDTGSDESQDSGQSEDEPQDGSTQSKDGSTDEDGLAKFAKAQGIEDTSELSERELRLLKVARDNQRSARESKKEDKDALDSAVDDIHKPTEGSEDEDEFTKETRITREEIAQLKANQRLSDFYRRHGDAEDYAKEMKEILIEEKDANGIDAARFLSTNLDRLLVLAKDRRGNNDADVARETGRREAYGEIRRKQEAGGEHGQASSSSSGAKKLTREAIAAMPDDEYAKRRDEIDAAIAAGTLT